MADVYRIQTSLTLAGNLAPELRKLLKTMGEVEKKGKDTTKAIGGWAAPIGKAVAEVAKLGKAMTDVRSKGGGLDKEIAKWAGGIGKANPELQTMRAAVRGVSTAAQGVSRSIDGWAGRIQSATSALHSLSAAAARVHLPHIPTTGAGGGGAAARPPRGANRAPGGATPAGGRGHGRRRGGGHGFGTHQARHVMMTAPALGAPTASLGYVEEALKLAGGVDQVEEIQRVQGGLADGKPLSPAALNDEIRKNRETAYALAGSARYTDPLENMKAITDLADLGKGDYGEARHLLPSFAYLNAVSSLIGQDEVKAKVHDKGQNRYLARALDQMGVMAKPQAEQKTYFDAAMQGIIGTRGIFKGSELFGAVSHSGGTATNWSPEFIGGVLPMLSEQMKGASAGDALYAFTKHMYKGQVSSKREALEMLNLGLIQKSDMMEDDKGRFIGVKRGAIKGSEEHFGPGKANAFGFYKDVLKPLLSAKGITSHEDIDKTIDSLTFAKNYAKMLHEFAANEANIEANLKRFKTQGDPQGLIDNTMGGQLSQLTGSLTTFATALADPQVGAAKDVLKTIGGAFNDMGSAMHGNPEGAKVAFGAVAGIVTAIAASGLLAIGAVAVGSVGLPAAAVGVAAGAIVSWMAIDWKSFSASAQVALDAIKWVGKQIASAGAPDAQNAIDEELRQRQKEFLGNAGYFDRKNDPTIKPADAGAIQQPGTAGMAEANKALQEAQQRFIETGPAAAGAAQGTEALKSAAEGAPGPLNAAASALGNLIAAARGAAGATINSGVESHTAPPVARGNGGAPALDPHIKRGASYAPVGGARPTIQVASVIHMDRRPVGKAMSRHFIEEADNHNGTGLFDDNTLQTPVGYPATVIG